MARSLRAATASCCELTAQRPASTFPRRCTMSSVRWSLRFQINSAVGSFGWCLMTCGLSPRVSQSSRVRWGERLAPRAAVALDLMDSGDPRHWVAAKNLIEARG